MSLTNQEIYSFLKKQGITHLHHANTLATSLTFIKNEGLLSRGLVESLGLFQTTQDSDNEDKHHKVWNDVFFDTKDLHGLFPRQNLYGPVLFKFSIDIINQEGLTFAITKGNPMFWPLDILDDKKYFKDIEDLENNWKTYPIQRKMVTVRNQMSVIPFDNLENIILDDPNVTIYGDTVLHNESLTALKKELDELKAVKLKPLFSVRNCNNCYCQDNYLRQHSVSKLSKFFLPVVHQRFTNT